MKKLRILNLLGLVSTLVVILSGQAQANLYQWEGWSAASTWVSFEADLSITGDDLTIILRNTSAATLAPADLLSSFYFDIYDDDLGRPTLSDYTAVGSWIEAIVPGDDKEWGINVDITTDTGGLISSQGPVHNPRSDGWDFKETDETSFPFLGFGIGTVGNNSSGIITDSDNQFNGSVVDGLDYSIAANADIETSNLEGRYLISSLAEFTFTGLEGWGNEDIGLVAFGLGTGPDSFHYTPIPAAIILGMLGLSSVGAVGWKLRKFT